VNHTLAALLCARASERPGHPFVSFPDREVSYTELHDRAEALARGLLATGLRPGGHVGILMTNCVAYLELFFAVHLAGEEHRRRGVERHHRVRNVRRRIARVSGHPG